MAEHITCDRCDHDLSEALVRHMDEDGPSQCPRCGLERRGDDPPGGGRFVEFLGGIR